MKKTLLRLNNDINEGHDVPKLILSLTAYRKMTIWTHLAADLRKWEVSGLGTCLKKHGGYFVSDVWLIEPQKVAGASVDQDPAAINALIQNLVMGTGEIRESKDSNKISFVGGRDIVNIRFLWHSHVDFGVGWSGTDDKTARFDFCPDAKWTINLVLNTKGHFLARMDFPEENHALKEEAIRQGSNKIVDTTINKLPIYLLIGNTNKQAKAIEDRYLQAHEKFLKRTERVAFKELNPEISIPSVTIDRNPYMREERLLSPRFPDPIDSNSGRDLFEELDEPSFEDLVEEQDELDDKDLENLIME